MELKIEKIVNYRKPYLGRDGKERPSTSYYLVVPFENGEKRVCIDAKFAKDRPSDRVILDLVAITVIIRDEEKSSVDKKPESK